MANVKKLTGYAGFGVWAADKMKTANDAMDAYKLSNDPAKLSEAVTKWAEIAAGFAVGEIVNKAMSKESLNKVMDSMRSKSTKFDRMMKDKPTYCV